MQLSIFKLHVRYIILTFIFKERDFGIQSQIISELMGKTPKNETLIPKTPRTGRKVRGKVDLSFACPIAPPRENTKTEMDETRLALPNRRKSL